MVGIFNRVVSRSETRGKSISLKTTIKKNGVVYNVAQANGGSSDGFGKLATVVVDRNAIRWGRSESSSVMMSWMDNRSRDDMEAALAQGDFTKAYQIVLGTIAISLESDYRARSEQNAVREIVKDLATANTVFEDMAARPLLNMARTTIA